MAQIGRRQTFIAVGANLADAYGRTPADACKAAVARMAALGLEIVGVSRWYETAPVPDLGGPWYVNGVVHVTTALDPVQVLDLLHRIEAEFGRVRRRRWEARPLDLDLLDQDGVVRAPAVAPTPIVVGAAVVDDGRAPDPELPHPRLAARGFVLLPLADVAPDWRHPVTGESVASLIAALPPGQMVRPIGEVGAAGAGATAASAPHRAQG
ncbi:2-amino-4-hydroxy-6-hydroxymethyldihydropteridine diphosphokinase [Tistrella bauzanensis]